MGWTYCLEQLARKRDTTIRTQYLRTFRLATGPPPGSSVKQEPTPLHELLSSPSFSILARSSKRMSIPRIPAISSVESLIGAETVMQSAPV